MISSSRCRPARRIWRDVVALLAAELVELEQLREAEDRVHRRAQLVADAGEELALRAVRALGLLLRAAQVARALGDALLELRRVAPQPVVKPRVLDRCRSLRGQRLDPLDVFLCERGPSTLRIAHTPMTWPRGAERRRDPVADRERAPFLEHRRHGERVGDLDRVALVDTA